MKNDEDYTPGMAYWFTDVLWPFCHTLASLFLTDPDVNTTLTKINIVGL